MKHINNDITRIFTFLHILEHFILNKENQIETLNPLTKVSSLFLENFEVKLENLDLEMHRNLTNSYIKNYEIIEKIRIKNQKRDDLATSLSLKLLINLAFAEYYYNKKDKNLIIKIYINISSIFFSDSGRIAFAHSVIDKGLTEILLLENKENNLA